MSEVFVVFPPAINNGVIYGRNSFSFCCKEILFFSPNDGTVKCQSTDIPKESNTFGYILNGTCGANDQKISISTLFADNKPAEGLSALDLTKLALERSDSAEKAVEVISTLIDKYNKDESVDISPKYAFFICDIKEAYVMNIVGKLWAAERITEGCRAFGKGFAVTTKIDKKSQELEDKLKEIALFDGSSELNFSQTFSMEVAEIKWPNDEPVSGFSAQKMFEVLRSSAECSETIASSFVSVLKESVAVHWFTGTPDPRESVFKPFIFTNDARISTLTALKEDDETPLRKLHENRKWDQVGELLKSLEKSCVDEIDGYVENAPTDELNELLKDCVEAEVKFYR
ncbi:CLUMA_CG010537, isoform A [Clunio marinus]|uniref:CLUMA_CG010537, isoform A n=1 Tax=Clunio marinus TaxID=568069 RepID=A0A1J1IC55_9DIPT|nr:CLUMA_CG010537, isoform A [Clunio marinus]